MEPLVNPGAAKPDLIKDSDERQFTADVMEASKETPVLVDFWADWCGPCKQLTPILERAVQKANGKVKLVKINVDQNQNLAAQLRIQSLPTVYIFKDGRPVDGFQGMVQESQIDQIIQSVAGDDGGSQIDAALAQADQLFQAGQAQDAAGLYSQILQADSANRPALAGLAEAYLALGQPEQARELLNSVPEAERTKAPFNKVKAALDLRDEVDAAGDPGELKARIDGNPDDLQARYDLALTHIAHGEREAAAEQLLEIIRRDREWQDDAARKQLVKLFEAAGPADPFTLHYRRVLSSILFA